jgi:hypothetical protein
MQSTSCESGTTWAKKFLAGRRELEQILGRAHTVVLKKMPQQVALV